MWPQDWEVRHPVAPKRIGAAESRTSQTATQNGYGISKTALGGGAGKASGKEDEGVVGGVEEEGGEKADAVGGSGEEQGEDEEGEEGGS